MKWFQLVAFTVSQAFTVSLMLSGVCPAQDQILRVAPTNRGAFQPPQVVLHSVTRGTDLKPGFDGSIVGQMGEQYEIRVFNPNSTRAVAVISVDGLSPFTGRTTQLNDPGYIIPARDWITVRGWRRGDHESAAFRFTTPEQSYGGQMGYPRQIGHIQVALIMEKPYHTHSRPSQGSAFRSNGGTAYGQSISDRIRWAPFERSSTVSRCDLRYTLHEHQLSRLSRTENRDQYFVPAPPGHPR